jgi:hypothetical protein
MSDAEARMDRLRRAARYRIAQQSEREGGAPERGSLDPDEVREERRQLNAENMSAYASAAVEVAERQGAFEHNRYHGKPLPWIDGRHDPDWWIRGKVERERLTGLGPAALSLRKEDAELEDLLDEQGSEDRVREILADFNARVVAARRQLAGGPPVVTQVRDVESEVASWRDRLEARLQSDAEAADPQPVPSRRRWWRRDRRNG